MISSCVRRSLFRTTPSYLKINFPRTRPSRLFFSLISQGNSKTSSTLLKWPIRLVKSAMTIAAAGILFQDIATKRDAVKYPPPGTFVDVGGCRMHLQCSSNNLPGPTVVLISGLACNSLEWSLVQPKIADFASVVSFDRLGTGWSDPTAKKRSADSMVNELYTALQNANVPGPYLLVGHTTGGLEAQLFAKRFPNKVAGLVLVESAHEDETVKIAKPAVDNNGIMLLTHLGFTRLFSYLPDIKKTTEAFSPSVRAQYRSTTVTAKSVHTVLREYENYGESCNDVKKAKGFFHNKPLVVIAAKEDASGSECNSIPFQLQKNLATKSCLSRFVISEKNCFSIPRDDANLIVKELRSMFEIIEGKR